MMKIGISIVFGRRVVPGVPLQDPPLLPARLRPSGEKTAAFRATEGSLMKKALSQQEKRTLATELVYQGERSGVIGGYCEPGFPCIMSTTRWPPCWAMTARPN